MKIIQYFVFLLLVTGFGRPAFSKDYIAPELEFTCELRVTISPAMKLGQTAHGERIIIPITGGTFEGPKMKGEVLSGGADYQYFNKDLGRTELEAIYNLRTDDGVLIHVRNVGLYVQPQNGEENHSEAYFRTAPVFEAPADSKYAWLNNAIFICKPVGKRDYISIQVWKVL